MKAVLYGAYPGNQVERLRALLSEPYELSVVIETDTLERKTAELATADVLVTNEYYADDPPVPRARLLQCAGAGIERLALDRLPEGCGVCNSYGHEITIAEYVIAAVLDWSVGLRARSTVLKDGTWALADWADAPPQAEANGKTLGIIGYGRIGREVARRAKALGMKVIALSAWRNSVPDGDLLDRTFAWNAGAAFAPLADYLVVACPLSDETRGMVNAEWIAAMKPSAVVINVARGAVIDEEALYAALAEKRLRGATLDVWWNYPQEHGKRVPIANFPFHALDNVVMTPHVSGRSLEGRTRRFQQVAHNLNAFARGEDLINVVVPLGAPAAQAAG
jgi:phosphoglycerate dehydrogenase-like enzyme